MACDKCGGSGWIVSTDRSGYSSAAPCSCRRPAPKLSHPGTAACIRVAGLILANAPYAPKNDADIRAILEAWLVASIESADELERFMLYALERMGEWAGIGGLRELLDNMRKKRGEDMAAAETDRKLLEWREEAKRLGPGVALEPLRLEGRKLIPKPNAVVQESGIRYTDADLAAELDAVEPVTEDDRLRKTAELQRQVLERMKAHNA